MNTTPPPSSEHPPANPAHKTTLQGQPLQDFIASLHDIWWEPKEWDELENQRAARQEPWGDPPEPHPSGIPLAQRSADLIAQVLQYRFVPQTPNELERLYCFMADLGMYEAYTLLLDTEHRKWGIFTLPSVIDDAFERSVWEIKLNFCVVDALFNIVKNGGKCWVHLEHAVLEKIIALPAPQTRNQTWDVYNLWGRVSSWAKQIRDRQLFERAEQEQIRINNFHQLSKPLLPDNVKYHIALADFAQHWEYDGDTLHHVNEAIAHMVQARAPESQWDSLFAHLLDISPVQIPLALKAYEEYLERTEQPPPAHMVRAERQVLAARRQAQAKAALGKLDAAIDWARRGHFGLHRDSGYDVFGQDLLKWLAKADRMDDAAELVLQSLFHNRRCVRDIAFELAWKQAKVDKNPQRLALWLLALLWAGEIPAITNAAKENGKNLKSAQSYLKRIEQTGVAHPAITITQGWYWAESGQYVSRGNKWAKALPLLEKGVLAAPAFANEHITLLLWCARFVCLNEQAVRELPIPESAGAVCCFRLGWQLAQGEYQHCPQKYWQAHATLRQKLSQHYYEHGWLCFASFPHHESNFLDGDRKIHALLCNNLGNIYRIQKDYQTAIERYKESTVSWPCAQPYANLMRCFHELKDWKAEADMAEKHWQVVQEYGYQGSGNYYNPARYALQIAHALHQSGRGSDIQLWIARLNEWWQQREKYDEKDENTDKNKTCRGDYLNALSSLLSFYAIDHPQEAEPLLREHLDEIEHLDKKHAGEKSHGCCKRYAAAALLHCARAGQDTAGDEGLLQQAAHFFRLALSCLAPEETEEIGLARAGLAECAA